MNDIIKAVKLSADFVNFVRPSPHSKYSPSSADRWLSTGCPFSTSFILAQNYEEEKNDYSDEGTLAHSYCEAMFRHIFYGMSIPASLIEEINMWIMGEVHKRGDALEEMDRCAREYVDVISFWLKNVGVIGSIIHFGLEVGTPIIPEKGCFGTSDCIIVGTKGSVVIDFKYGKGKNVSADTVQCKVYAAGLIRYMECPAEYPVHIVIHQPRTSAHPKEHVYNAHELRGFLNTIWNSILASEEKDLQPKEGNHCFWCPAKRTKIIEKKCPSILGKAERVANERFDSFLADMHAPVDSIVAPNPKRDMAIAKIHALFPLMKQIVKDTTEEIEMRIGKGEAVYGFTLVNEEGKRELTGVTDEEKAKLVKEKFPTCEPWKEIPATTKLKTITEIEKEIGKNKLNIICTKKVTKKVSIMSDKMQAILGDMTAFAQMINNGQGQED